MAVIGERFLKGDQFHLTLLQSLVPLKQVGASWMQVGRNLCPHSLATARVPLSQAQFAPSQGLRPQPNECGFIMWLPRIERAAHSHGAG